MGPFDKGGGWRPCMHGRRYRFERECGVCCNQLQSKFTTCVCTMRSYNESHEWDDNWSRAQVVQVHVCAFKHPRAIVHTCPGSRMNGVTGPA